MSEVPSDLKYTTTHEWVKNEEDGTVTIGITDTAQKLLGDLVFVELPADGTSVSVGDECGVVESVKAASDIYSPVNGEIIAINDALSSAPELINQDPYGDGWIFKVQLTDEAELDELLDAEEYQEHVESEDH